eukprot:Sro46_g027280.2  (335) ;mRNA; f:10175-11181
MQHLLISLLCSFSFWTALVSGFVSLNPSNFLLHHHQHQLHQRQTRLPFPAFSSSDPSSASSSNESSSVHELKTNLLSALTELRDLQDRDGDFSDIDWGTKGGELTETGRVPQQVDYSLISKDVGNAADKVMTICNQLAEVNPTAIPTLYLGDKQKGDQAPLNGPWKLLFCNAADAIFAKDSKRGAASAQNVVNAKKGKITNVITFDTLADGTEPTLKQLNIIIKATAVTPQRVQLDFRYAKVVLTKLPFGLPIPFGQKRKLALYIPVPAAFVTTCIELVRKVARFLRIRRKKKQPNEEEEEERSARGYFDVLFLDDQLRVHKTGQGNLFVQAKEE